MRGGGGESFEWEAKHSKMHNFFFFVNERGEEGLFCPTNALMRVCSAGAAEPSDPVDHDPGQTTDGQVGH